MFLLRPEVKKSVNHLFLTKKGFLYLCLNRDFLQQKAGDILNVTEQQSVMTLSIISEITGWLTATNS